MHEDPDDQEDRFIPGVYNFCNRWCERCRFEDRCRVRHEERETAARHLLQGEDADDPEVVMSDVAASLQEALGMLEQMAAEEGIDLEDLPPPPPRRQHAREDALSQRADRWGDRLGRFLEQIRQEMPGLAPELTRKVEESPLGIERAGEQVLAGLHAARDAYDLLCHYRYFIAVKTMRAVGGVELEDEEEDEEISYDSLGTAKLLAASLEECEAGLWHLAEFNPPWQAEALPLAAEAQGVREALGKRFPGYQDFVRPGFDEEL